MAQVDIALKGIEDFIRSNIDLNQMKLKISGNQLENAIHEILDSNNNVSMPSAHSNHSQKTIQMN